MNIINSLNNKKIKDLAKLKKASERRAKKIVLIDGLREIELAKKYGHEIIELYYCPKIIKKHNKNFFNLERERIIEVGENVFKKISYKDAPDGYLAITKERVVALEQIKLGRAPLIVILESVEKPGNLGAVIRTAVAAGVDALIINDNQTDIYNPNVIRASEGLIFAKPVVISSVGETQAWLNKNNILSFGAATNGKNNYTKEDLSGPVALVLGSEAKGLSGKWLSGADKLIKIPMVGGIDSLNVSVSAAILIYEALRQREG